MSRYKFNWSQKTVKVQDLYCGQVRTLTAVASAKADVRVQVLLRICLRSRSIPIGIGSKKCDEQLTHSTYDKSIVSGTI